MATVRWIVVSAFVFIASIGFADEDVESKAVDIMRWALSACKESPFKIAATLQKVNLIDCKTMPTIFKMAVADPRHWTGKRDARWEVLNMIQRFFERGEAESSNDFRHRMSQATSEALRQSSNSWRKKNLILGIKVAGQLWTVDDIPFVLEHTRRGRQPALGMEILHLSKMMNAEHMDRLAWTLRNGKRRQLDVTIPLLVLTELANDSDYIEALKYYIFRYQNLDEFEGRNNFPFSLYAQPPSAEMALPKDTQRRLALNIEALQKMNRLYAMGDPQLRRAVDKLNHFRRFESPHLREISREFFARLTGPELWPVGPSDRCEPQLSQ
jgi:hypothetical protein